MQKWEYAIVTHTAGMTGNSVYAWVMQNGKPQKLKGFRSAMPLLEALSMLGEQGWQVVAGSQGPVRGAGGDDIVVVLMRPKTD
jgi:hypothetical protein